VCACVCVCACVSVFAVFCDLHCWCVGLAGFRVFVESIFYIGKGKNSRSTQHLKDARDTGKNSKVGGL